MKRPAAESRADVHRPAPGALRRTSRTHWPAPRVLAYIAMQLAAAALMIFGLVWLLAHS